MQIWDNIIIALVSGLIGGLVGVVLTWWKMRASSAIRKNERHNSALNAIDKWTEHVRGFFVRYDLQEQTTDFRLLSMGLTPSEIAAMTARTRNLARLAKDITGKDLSSPLKEILKDLEQFEEVLSRSRWEDTDIAKCVDSLRDQFTSFLSLISDIERR